MQNPLQPHYVALGQLRQYALVDGHESKLLLVVPGLLLPKLSLEGVISVLVFLVEVGVEAGDVQVSLRDRRREKRARGVGERVRGRLQKEEQVTLSFLTTSVSSSP